MASSSSSSNQLYHNDHTIFIQPVLKNLSTLRDQLSEIDISHVGDCDQTRTNNQLDKLCRDLNYIVSAFEKLDSFGSHVGDMLSQLEHCVRDVLDNIRGAPLGGESGDGPNSAHPIQSKLNKLACSIINLKARVPWLPSATPSLPVNYRRKQINSGPYVHNEKFGQRMADPNNFPYMKLIMGIDDPLKQLLLYFAAFPHDSVIKKRVLKNWWLADVEALLRLPADEAENKADRALEELMLLGLIKGERKQRRLVGYKMPNPWVHLAVVRVAEQEEFFGFDSIGNPTVKLRLQRGCLVYGGSSLNFLYDSYSGTDLERLASVFNISEPYPDFKPQLFSKFKGIRVLGLGKWQSSNDCHIEVESIEFLKAPRSMCWN